MSIKKLKEQTEKWSFSEIKLSDRWFYPGFFFFGVGVIGNAKEANKRRGGGPDKEINDTSLSVSTHVCITT